MLLESESDLVDSLVTSFAGKTPLEQVQLFREYVLCYIESKSSKQQSEQKPCEVFSERLAREQGPYVKDGLLLYRGAECRGRAKKIIQTHEIHPEESENEWKHEKLNISIPIKG